MAADFTVAKTILAQMGGQRRLVLMTGANNFAADDSSIQFKFKGSRKVNTCRIKLDWGSDTYTMELWKCNMRSLEMVKVFEMDDMYYDMLIPVFEKETGLYLGL